MRSGAEAWAEDGRATAAPRHRLEEVVNYVDRPGFLKAQRCEDPGQAAFADRCRTPDREDPVDGLAWKVESRPAAFAKRTWADHFDELEARK